jgi:hypothetical protein
MAAKLAFICVFTLLRLEFLQGQISQRFFKKMIFPAAIWPPLVYKTLDVSIETNLECVGQCLIESSTCNVFFFESSGGETCRLGTMSRNLNVIGGVQSQTFGYVALGETLRQMTHRRKSNFIRTPKVRSVGRKSFRQKYDQNHFVKNHKVD